MGKHNKSFRKRLMLSVLRALSRPVAWLLAHLPLWCAAPIGSIAGSLGYHLSRRYRTVAVSNLLAAFPEISDADARAMAKQVFCNFGRASVEFFMVAGLSRSAILDLVELHGAEHIDAALRRGRGAIILTAHMGNWEAVARRLEAEGYALTVIARDSDDPTMTGLVNSIRRGGGYTVVERDVSVRAAMRCLRSNELLGILPDQNTLGNCIFVEFFGRPVATAPGAAMFALKTGAAILPAFSAWDEAAKRYSAVIHPPLGVAATGDIERDARAITQAYTAIIEAEIRKRPTQWLWVHNRWKRAGEAPVPFEPAVPSAQ